jgi:hypothetical protein
VFDDFQKFNSPANVGHPFHNKEWLQQALCKDQQAAGLLPPKLPGGPILLGAHARAERAYQDWKWVVDELWDHEHHRLQMAAPQCLLDEHAAHECQEAARQEAACAAQCLLDERAALKHQEAMRCQRILNKEAASCQRAAHAQQTAATQIIFLWLCRWCLHAQLVCQTLWQQQRKAVLARLQYEQECCARVAMADERQWQAAATREKVLAKEANERRCQEKAVCASALVEMVLAKEWHHHKMAQLAAMLAEMALTAEQHCHEAATQEKALADKANKQHCHKTAAQEKALANNTELQHCQGSAAHTAALAELVSEVEQSHRESADCPAVSAVTTLANECCHQREAERGTTLGETALAVEQRWSLLAVRAAELVLAMARVAVLADLSLPEPALAEDKWRQEESAKKQHHADEERVMAPVLPPGLGNTAIQHI